MSSPLLLTIILNYKTPDMTLKATEFALREMECISGEIIIVDNDSRDGSFEKLHSAVCKKNKENYTYVRVIESGYNIGFGGGINLGIRTGLSTGKKPDFIYILNSDAFPDKGSIRELVNYLELNPGMGIAGSYIHGPEPEDGKNSRNTSIGTAWSEPEGQPHCSAFRFPTLSSEFEGAIRLGLVTRLLRKFSVAIPIPESTCEVDWVAGASLMIRRDVLDEIGLFDERFFLYFEETDLCRRASLAGWSTAYVRESEVTHIGSVSTGMSTWKRVPMYWFDSRLYYFKKNHGVLYAGAATILHALGATLFRLRECIDRSVSNRGNPPYFVRDLVRHALKHTFK